MPVLTSKLVISEELNLRQDSSQSNALKTCITETETLSERKGAEAELIQQACCFLFTSDHLPLWIEPRDRRCYLIEVDHEGHAAGPKASEFASLVGRLRTSMTDDAFIVALYKDLMHRKLSKGFSAKTLNVVEDSTPLMARVQGALEMTVKSLLRDYLNEKKMRAVPEMEIARIVREDLGSNPNATKHLLPSLGWQKAKAKWNGCAYSRAIWVQDGYWVENGFNHGPARNKQRLGEHFEKAAPAPLLDEEFSKVEVQPVAEGDLY